MSSDAVNYQITMFDRVFGRAGIKQAANLYSHQMDILAKQSQDLSSELDEARKQLLENTRPSLNDLVARGQYRDFRSPYLLQNLFIESYKNSTLRHCINIITDGLTKQGMDMDPTFERLCIQCGEQYDSELEVCTNCGNPELIEPDYDEIGPIEIWLKNMNYNEQSIEKLTHQWAEDLEVADDLYVMYIYQYQFLEFIGPTPKLVEIVRGDPAVMELIHDQTGILGEGPNRKYFCLFHRDEMNDEPGFCRQCKQAGIDNELTQAWYRSWNMTNFARQTFEPKMKVGEWNYYAPWEVFHTSKYSPSLTYGFPPPITLWKELNLLDHQLEFMLYFYVEGRYPRGVLSIVSDNPDDVYRKAEQWKEKHQEDPHYVPVVAVSSQTGRGKVEWVPLADSVKEMEWINVREEINNRIAAFFHLSKSYMNDPNTGTGLGNQSLDMSLTQEGMDLGQRVFNEEVYPNILLHLATDIGDPTISERWELKLNKNRMSEDRQQLQFLNEAADFATKMAGMGFEVRYDASQEDPMKRFSFSEEPRDEMAGFMDQGMWGEPELAPEVPGEEGQPEELGQDETEQAPEEIL